MKFMLSVLLSVSSSSAFAGVYIPESSKLPCYGQAVIAAQKATLKQNLPVSDTTISTASSDLGVNSFMVVVRAEFEGAPNSEENDIYYKVDILRKSNKCEVLEVKNLALTK